MQSLGLVAGSGRGGLSLLNALIHRSEKGSCGLFSKGQTGLPGMSPLTPADSRRVPCDLA